MKITFPKTASLLVAALAIFCAPSALFAQTAPNIPDSLHTWDGPPGSGPSNDWFDAGNWDNPGVDTVPGSGDNTQINNSGTARITGSGLASTNVLTLGNGVGESGTLRVIDTSSLKTFGNFIVGDAGTGTVFIKDQAKVVAVGTNLIIGRQLGSLGSVDVTGTFSRGAPNDFNLTSDNNTIVGDSSELMNTLDIHNGGRVATGNNAIIGNNAGSNGFARVGDDGPNSESYWFIQNNLFVGNDGTGEFRIRDGGFAGTADGNTFIGNASTGVGVMSVEGTGLLDGPSLFTTNNLFVGDAGDGTLRIRDVGLVNASGRVVAGNQSMSTGHIDVSGDYMGGSSDYNLLSGGNTVIGGSGDGHMDIHDGGRVFTGGTGFIGDNSDGTGVVRVGTDGPNSESFWRISPFGPITANNTVSNDRADSVIAGNIPSGNPSNLIVGNNGNGTLVIHDGGLVNVHGNVYIGRNSGSMGRVSVDGSSPLGGNSELLSFGPNGVFVGGDTAGPGGDGALRLTNGGTVTAAAGLTVWGPGSGNKGLLEVDHTYVINAPITFDGGRLRFLDDTTFTNDAVLGTTQMEDGVFVDTNGTTSTLTGIFSGGGELTKRDAGTLIIPVGTAEIYTGDTVVHEGTLQLDGSVTSNTFVQTNGTLTGIGTIFGNLHNNGVVAPGDSPGTLSVVGNYVQTSTADFSAEVGGLVSGVDSDLLTMTGTGSLDGSIHVIRINNFNPVPGDRVTVLNADGGLGGTQFATFVPVGWLGLIQPTLDYNDNPDHVDVVFELTSSFASQGLTRNEICVGQNLDAAVDLINSNEAAHNLIGIIGQVPVDELPAVFDLIAPEELASIYEISFQHGIMEMTNYRNRMSDIRAEARGYCEAPQPVVDSSYAKGSDGKTVLDGKTTLPDKTVAPVADTCPDKRYGMFATGYGQGVSVGDDDSNEVHGYDIMTGGFSTGFDALVTHNFAVGIGGGYASSSADLVNDGRVNVETTYVAGYATWFSGGFYVDGAASFGWNSIDTKRLGFGGFEDGATDGAEFNGIIGGGYDWKTHCWTIGPFATFHYTYVEFDSFDEHGNSVAPLHFPDQNQDAERGSVGLKVAYDMTRGNIIFRPEVRAAFQHEFGNTDYPIQWSFRDITDEHICDAFGPSTGQDSALIDAGFSLILGKCHDVSAFAFYSGNIGRDNDTRNGVTGGLRLSF
jgi:T5SS/PEP-CTERM-associated repeat protein/autotransporter-associated beta strand protein